MELVGRAVKKRFPGFGLFSGVVESYDPSVGYFKVLYEDGDAEEVDLGEIAGMLTVTGEEVPPPLPSSSSARPTRRSGCGRPPKKRRGSETDPPEAGGEDADLGGRAGQGGVLEGNDGFLDVNLEGDGVSLACLVTRVNGGCSNQGNLAVHEAKLEEDEVCFAGKVLPTSTELGDDQNLNKRRRVSANSSASPAVSLRRSARRGRTTALSPQNHGSGQVARTSVLDTQTIVLDVSKCEVINEELKLELPPSSTHLDLDGLSIPDFFSVYSCLRSFSRVLFLSPFRLEAFLAALRSKFANTLIDSIHFSVLQTLKCHLELLAEEGSESATCCLRSLNWDLLGLITWPLFLAQYLLVHGSRMKSKCKLTHLKLLDVEYYRQPANVKLEILRCLCDDVIEVEAIRLELNTRGNYSDPNMDGYDFVALKKNGLIKSDFGNDLDEGMPGVADWNSDDCCLCGMDGSLICCDGCPAAFHSRCVGVAKDVLPEGDWFCPECLMNRFDGLAKMLKSSQGAEFLGTDPHGRLYFSSCGYLLVCDSCDVLASYHFYNKDDLDTVFSFLKSSGTSYSAILHAISSYWENAIETFDARQQHLDHAITDREEAFAIQSHSINILSPDPNAYDDNIEHDSKIENSDPKSIRSSACSQTCRLNAGQLQLTTAFLSSKNADEVTNIVKNDQLCQQNTANYCDDSGSPVKEVIPIKPVNLAIQNRRCFGVASWSDTSFITKQKKDGPSQLQFDASSYVNSYSFGRIAASVSKEFMRISSETNCKEIKTAEEIASAQTKIIFERSISSCLHNDLKPSLDMQKERCGWCHACKTCGSSKCIFVVSDDKHLETPKPRTVGVRSEKKKKSHIVSTMRQILSIESNLQGLLSGIWDNPHHSNNWRKAVQKASDVSSLKNLLLMLEFNLRRVALSPEWMKPIDFSSFVGLASQILINLDASSSSGTRRQGKKTTTSLASSTWWRGGRLSRQVWHWNILPHSLAFKGGRQAGCKKISDLVYPDGLDLARISKCLAWRASVEMSKTVSQLFFHIKELDSNIKWVEFSKSQHSLNTKNESKSSAKLFKKVVIRRKCVKGVDTKYLLDFGKRENIPPLVTRYGDTFEGSASERKKYWLTEAHVPLNLIKAFEEKKLTCILKKEHPMLSSGNLSSHSMLKHKRSKDFSYLFKRAEKLETELCGLCKKDVLIREAVTCQICNGFFHRKHFRLPKKHSKTVTYICFGCKNKESVKLKTKGEKVTKKVPSCTKLKFKPEKQKSAEMDNKKNQSGEKKVKQNETKSHAKKRKNSITCTKRKRTMVEHSFWLNGLLRTRKPDDARGNFFRESKVLLPFQMIDETCLQPICSVCFKDYSPEAVYVGCENCQDWFHGDAYQLTLDNINNIIGFKCHKCRSTSIPTCPFSQNVTL